MIKLNRKDGRTMFVSPENIESISQSEVSASSDSFDFKAPRETVTVIAFSDNNATIVFESPEEVARKVLEYRLAMIEYRSLSADGDYLAADRVKQRIEELSGLSAEKGAE